MWETVLSKLSSLRVWGPHSRQVTVSIFSKIYVKIIISLVMMKGELRHRPCNVFPRHVPNEWQLRFEWVQSSPRAYFWSCYTVSLPAGPNTLPWQRAEFQNGSIKVAVISHFNLGFCPTRRYTSDCQHIWKMKIGATILKNENRYRIQKGKCKKLYLIKWVFQSD